VSTQTRRHTADDARAQQTARPEAQAIWLPPRPTQVIWSKRDPTAALVPCPSSQAGTGRWRTSKRSNLRTDWARWLSAEMPV